MIPAGSFEIWRAWKNWVVDRELALGGPSAKTFGAFYRIHTGKWDIEDIRLVNEIRFLIPEGRSF